MRPGARREHVRRLHELADSVRETADKMEAAELPDLRRVGVGWGGENGCEISVGGTYFFKKDRDERHIVDIISALAWGLFESRRNNGDPSDPKILAEVRGILQSVGESILGPPKPRCSKCDGMQHICVACNGECRVGYNDTKHDRNQALCPECSTWLAPQAPR